MSADTAVWITGVGTANPLGCDLDTFASNLLSGRSGVVPIMGIPVDDHPCRIAGRIGVIPVPPGWPAAEFAKLSHLNQLVLWCCAAAVADAGLWERRAEMRIGMVLGLGAEALRDWEIDAHAGGNLVNARAGRARRSPGSSATNSA